MKKSLLFLPMLLLLLACGRDVATVKGPPGPAGTQGEAGPTGKEGEDGEDGEDGAPAPVATPSPYDVEAHIIPCGRQSDEDEILLQLYGGKILMSYTDSNKKTYLIEAGVGTYRTSDAKRCLFTIHADGTVTW